MEIYENLENIRRRAIDRAFREPVSQSQILFAVKLGYIGEWDSKRVQDRIDSVVEMHAHDIMRSTVELPKDPAQRAREAGL